LDLPTSKLSGWPVPAFAQVTPSSVEILTLFPAGAFPFTQ
jgi:hypothetical protein